MQKINKNIKKYKKNFSSMALVSSQMSLEEKVFKFLVGSLVFLAIVYVMLIANIVFSIVERNAFNSKNMLLASDVRELEIEYLSIAKNIDLDFAYENGFKESKTEFASAVSSNNSKFAINEIR
jgi:hypothetical protein